MRKSRSVVTLTNSSTEKMSRIAMLAWLNETVNSHYSKVEELCSGVAYCQMLEMLFPNCIGMKKVKGEAKLGHEYLYNLKLVQGALTRLKVPNVMPIDRLLKGHFQDNFEFLQWFRKFFLHHADGRENMEVPALHPGSARRAGSTPREGAVTTRKSAPAARSCATSPRNSAPAARTATATARSGATSAQNVAATGNSTATARNVASTDAQFAGTSRGQATGVSKSKSSLSTGRITAGRHFLSARQAKDKAKGKPPQEEPQEEAESMEDSPRDVDPKLLENINKVATHMHQLMGQIHSLVRDRDLGYMRLVYIDNILTKAREADPSEETQAFCHQVFMAMIPIFANDRLKSLGHHNLFKSVKSFELIHEKMPENPAEQQKLHDMPDESLEDETEPFSEFDFEDVYSGEETSAGPDDAGEI